jgi:Putative porin/TonB-dependent Receptor Plug Domain
MIIRIIVFQILLLTGVIFAQANDSVYVDTTKAGIIDTVSSDTTGFFSSQKEITNTDSIRSIFQKPFYSQSEFIDRKQIDFLDYRYTGDLFKPFGLSYLRQFGFVGHPNELILYGTTNVNYFENGIYANNRFSGNFNLNLIHSEMIDSIEIIPAPRGFLYGPAANPVSVNFIKRDLFSLRPYTRVKYYEGPNGEAFIDAIFNAFVAKHTLFTFVISNRKADRSYINSDFSIWQGEAHLKYLFSEKINLTASYEYNDYDAGLNGGVNTDSIYQLTSDLNSLLYNVLQAPVYYTERRQNIFQHNIGLRWFANPAPSSKTDLTIYYRFDKEEISNPLDVLDYPQGNKNKTFGSLLRQDFSLAFADINVLAQYERTGTRLFLRQSLIDLNQSSFSVSPIFNLNLIDSSIVPSVYYKFQNISNGVSKVFNGLGFDLALKLNDYLKLYGGYSMYKSFGLSNDVKTLELSARFSFDNLSVNAGLINRSESFLFVDPFPFSAGDEYSLDLGAAQIGGNLSFKFWKILLEASSYYDLSKHSSAGSLSSVSVSSPKFKLNGGIYLDSYFFKDNLNLKTGFAFNYNSRQRIFVSGIEKYLADKYYTIDFTLAGEIQKVAIAYFTWENLFDKTYYVVPYYPMFRRGIRFGVAWELFN